MSTAIVESKFFINNIENSITNKPRRSADIIDVVEVDNESRCQTILCLVDKNNIDSMLGAALWISKMDFDKEISIHAFHPMDDNSKAVTSHDQVINFGCYVPNNQLSKYRGKIHTKIFTYRNTFEGIKNDDTLEIIRPCDDWYGEEQAMVDNSIAFNVNQLMATNGNPSDIYSLKSMARDVALFVNFAHKGMKTVDDQIKIHNIRVALERAFSKSNIREAIRELTIKEDADGYRLRLETVRQLSKIHGRDEMFVIPSKGLTASPRRFVIKTFSCPTGMSRDLMKMILPVVGSCITYESIGHYKLMRIVTEDKRRSQFFAASHKPLHIWEEGETVVAIIPETK